MRRNSDGYRSILHWKRPLWSPSNYKKDAEKRRHRAKGSNVQDVLFCSCPTCSVSYSKFVTMAYYGNFCTCYAHAAWRHVIREKWYTAFWKHSAICDVPRHKWNCLCNACSAVLGVAPGRRHPLRIPTRSEAIRQASHTSGCQLRLLIPWIRSSNPGGRGRHLDGVRVRGFFSFFILIMSQPFPSRSSQFIIHWLSYSLALYSELLTASLNTLQINK
jgi:hypothetical protein